MARALRLALRESWNIPDEEWFKFLGPDWLLILLDHLSLQQREQVLFLFWRAWHLRNDLTFLEKGRNPLLHLQFLW